MSKYILSIDAGTTGVTIIIFDKNANVIKKEYAEFSQIYPQPGYVEHDPLEIWNTTKKLLKKISRVYNNKIHSIGITNQRETVVVWDKNTGRPIYNAIVWQCKRTSERCNELIKNQYSELIRNKTGLPISSYFSATKIEWIIDNVKNSKSLIKQKSLLFGTIDTWLIWNLTNKKSHITDHTNASRTMVYNINSFEWDDELLELFNVCKSMLPKIIHSTGSFGELELDMFSQKIPITGVAGDQQAALFGQYGYNENDTKCTYGTGCFMLTNTGQKKINSNNGLITTVSCNKQGKPAYAIEGSIFIGGAVIQWLRDELNIIKNAKETENIAKSLNGNDGVYIVPAFTGLGAPYWDMESKGTITGLTRGSNAKHLVRSALESIAFQVNDLIKCLNSDLKCEIKTLRVDGGATANNFLMQFQSDISKINIQKPSNIESTALGAALLSGIGSKYWNNNNIENLKNKKTNTTYSPEMKAQLRETLLQEWKKAINKCLMID